MTDPEPARKLLRNAYRELAVCVVVWLLAMAWTLGVCLLYGYRHDPESWIVKNGFVKSRQAADITLWFGFPDWIFFGVVLPWVVVTIFTMVYCLAWMPDDDLGSEESNDAT